MPDSTQQDTPVTVTPSPIDMPGAGNSLQARVDPKATGTPELVEVDEVRAPAKPAVQADVTTEEREELERLRNFRKQTRDWEKTAKENFADAQRYRELAQNIGGGEREPAEADPLAEIARLRTEIEGERREGLRERVARETGVPPSQIQGDDAESMKVSADKALSWAKDFIRQAGVPLAAPAANVTSNGKPQDEQAGQIKSRDDLDRMRPAEITAAYREGRLDYLMGKQT